MVTDGVDYYEMRFDPEDPYVQSAIKDSAKAGMVVYSIYWINQGWSTIPFTRTMPAKACWLIVTDATGGKSYWQGMGNPVTFQPYFEDLSRRLANQYEIGFNAGLTQAHARNHEAQGEGAGYPGRCSAAGICGSSGIRVRTAGSFFEPQAGAMREATRGEDLC